MTGVKITVTDPDETADAIDDDPLAESDEYVHTISGWAGAKHERSDEDGVEEVVTTYVNIDPASNEEFDEYYSVEDASSRTGVNGADADGELTLDTDPDDVAAAAKLGLYSAASFPTAGDQIKSYATEDDTDTEGVDESDESMFSGSFHGIPGAYSCTGTCTATADKNGLLMTLGGTWTFDPDDPGEGKMHLVYGVTADPDHLHFGYWLKTTPGEDDDPTTYAFQAFSGGAMAFDENNMGTSASAQVYGQAEYSGDAAGVYVRKTLRPDGTLAKASTGEFTADANLTAYFGGDDVRASKHYTIEGTVTDFRDGQTRFADWTVKLDPSDSFGGANNFTGDTTGSEGVDEGSWSGTFYGPSELTADTTDDGGARMQPSGVAGEFNAHFTNGHVAGAYGATKE